MGAKSIGELNVVISGKADSFENAVSKAQKSLAGFAAKATAPIAGFTAGLAGLGAMGSIGFGGFLKPVDALMSLFPGGKLAATTMGLGDMTEGLERTIERYRGFREATEKYGVSGSFFRSFQLALGPDADKAEKLLVKFTKYLTGNPETTRGANTVEAAFYRIRDAINAAGGTADKNRLLFEAFGTKTGLEAGGALEPGKMEKSLATVSELGLFDPRVMGGVTDILKLRKSVKLIKESNDALAFAFQTPTERGNIEWEKGNPFRAVTNWMEGGLRRLGRMTGFLSRDDLLNMAGKPVSAEEQRRLFQEATPEAKKAIEDLTRSIQDMGVSADILADRQFERLREQLDKLGGTIEQKANLEKEIQAAQDRMGPQGFLAKTMKALDWADRLRGTPEWRKALEGQEDFRKLPLADQDRLLKAARGNAAGDLAFANRSPLEKARDEFRKITDIGGPGANAAIGDLGRKLFGGFTVGGPTSLALKGSQEQAAIIDQINQREATDNFKLTVDFMRKVFEGMDAAWKKKAAQDNDFAQNMKEIFGDDNRKPFVPPG